MCCESSLGEWPADQKGAGALGAVAMLGFPSAPVPLRICVCTSILDISPIPSWHVACLRWPNLVDTALSNSTGSQKWPPGGAQARAPRDFMGKGADTALQSIPAVFL